MKKLLSILVCVFSVLIFAGIKAPKQLASFPVSAGKSYHLEVKLQKPVKAQVEIRFFNKAGVPVEKQELSLGRSSSSRKAPVNANGIALLDAVAGNGPNIQAAEARIFLSAGSAEAFGGWKFRQESFGSSGGLRPIPQTDLKLFAPNMIVNPSFEEGNGNAVTGWRRVGPGKARIATETFSGKRALLLTEEDAVGRWETVEPVALSGKDPLWLTYCTKFNKFATVYGHPDLLKPEFLRKKADGRFAVLPYNRFNEFNFYVFKIFYGSWNPVFAKPFFIPAGATHVRFYIQNKEIIQRATGPAKANFGNVLIDNVTAFQAPQPKLSLDRSTPFEIYTVLRPGGKLPPAVAPGTRIANTIWLASQISKDGNIYFSNQKGAKSLGIRLNNLLPVTRQTVLSAKIMDQNGKTIKTVSVKVPLPPSQFKAVALPIPGNLPFGAYTAECTALENGQTAATGAARFVLAEHPSRISLAEKHSPDYPFELGASLNWWLTGRVPSRLEAMDYEAHLMDLLGVRATRIAEVKDVPMNLQNRAATLKDAENKIQVWKKYFYPLLQKHRLAAYVTLMEQGAMLRKFPQTKAEWDLWREYHRVLAKGIAPYIDYMVFGNEGIGGYTANIPDNQSLFRISGFKGSTKDWFDLYREAHRGVKQGAPKLLFGPGQASDEGGLIPPRYFKLGGKAEEFDLWAVNSYQNPTGIAKNVARGLGKSAKAPKFGVIPETGLSPASRGKNRWKEEMKQAEFVPKVYLEVLHDAPFFKRITFFILRYHDYGIFDIFGQPRPAAASYMVMTDRLGAGHVEAEFPIQGGKFYVWRRINGEAVGVGWSDQEQPVYLEADTDKLTCDDMFGNHTVLKKQSGLYRVTLNHGVTYLLGAKKLSLSRAAVLNGGIAVRNNEPVLRVVIENNVAAAKKFTVSVRTPLSVRITPEKQELLIPGKGKKELFFGIRAFGHDDRIPLNIRITAQREDGLRIEKVLNHPFAICAPFTGKEADWNNAMILHADRADQSHAFTVTNPWKGPEDVSGEIRTLYDAKNLYLKIRVRDDKFAKAARNDRLFWADSCELGFLIPRGKDKVFYQFCLGLTDKGPVLYQHLPADLEKKIELGANAIKVSRDEKTKTTEFYVALPWKLLNDFHPAIGKEIPFSILIDDCDSNPPPASKTTAIVYDRKAIGWYGSGVANREFSAFGSLLFAGSAKSAAISPNLVKNPSFREGMKYWQKNVRPGRNKVRPDAQFGMVTDGADDRSAVRINVINLAGRDSGLAEYAQTIRVKPNCEYYVSAKRKVRRLAAWPSLYVEHQDQRGRQFGATVMRSPLGKKCVITDWHIMECRFRTPAKQGFIRISLRLQDLGAGEVYYDDVVVREVK